MSADGEAAVSFTEKFQDILLTYEERDIYNADESELYWRALPTKSIVLKDEKQPADFKQSKDRVTIMVCANAAGCHRIPLLMIGKSKNPRCFAKKTPENYYADKSAWMQTQLFIRWYDEKFIPAVEKYQESQGRTNKVLLLMDNAPVHPAASTLMREGGRFEVLYMPPNVTSLIQPMDQTVISSLKRNYRRLIPQDLIKKDDEKQISRTEFLKTFTIKDAYNYINTAWADVKESTLKNAWNKLRVENNENLEVPHLEINEAEVPLLEWFQCDDDEPGFCDPTDEDLIEDLYCRSDNNEGGDESAEELIDINNNDADDSQSTVTAEEAAQGLRKGPGVALGVPETGEISAASVPCSTSL